MNHPESSFGKKYWGGGNLPLFEVMQYHIPILLVHAALYSFNAQCISLLLAGGHMCTGSQKSKMLGWDDKHPNGFVKSNDYSLFYLQPFVKLFVNCIFIFEFFTAYP